MKTDMHTRTIPHDKMHGKEILMKAKE
jgi:hypothetical protein